MCSICQAMNPTEDYTFHTVPMTSGPMMAALSETGDATGTFPGMGAWGGDVIADGDTFDGTIASNSDVDLIQVVVEAGSTWTFQMEETGTNGGSFDPYLQLYDASGTLVDSQNTWSISGGNYTSIMSYTNSGTTDLTLYLSASDYAGFGAGNGTYTISADKVIDGPYGDFTVTEVANMLTSGTRSYGLSTQTYAWDVDVGDALTTNDSIDVDISRLDATGQLLATAALEAWSMAVGIDFNFTSMTSSGGFSTSGNGIIFYDNDDGAYANTQFYTSGEIINAFVNVSTDWLYGGGGISAQGTTIDSYSFQTYIHEIGHALGLSHGGFYNSSANYADDAAYANDSWQMSAMSYFSQSENTSITADKAYTFTPMIADMLAAQMLYGVAGDLRTGNTTYGVGSTAGGYYDDFATYAGDLAITIIDDGGIDTISFSTTVANQTVNLGDGEISDVQGLIGNLIINTGTIIENFISGSGNDNLTGNAVKNVISAGNGNDTVAGLDGDDILHGNGGDDMMTGDTGADTLNGGNGADTLDGGSEDDVIRGQGGNDDITGGDGNDSIFTGINDDTAYGGAGNDNMLGQGQIDTLFGGAGNDTLSGGSGNDLLDGGADDDTLYGNGNNDTLYGQAGDDFLLGAAGSDVLFGGGGHDTLNGSTGSDVITGGSGNDTMNGGDNADTFVFGTGFGDDRINAYEQGIDTLQLDDAIWGGGLTAQQVVASYGSLNGTGTILTLDFGSGNIIEVQSGGGINDTTLHLDLSIV